MTPTTRTTVACAGSLPVFNAAFDGDQAATGHAVEICSACPAELRERCLVLAMAAEEHEPQRYGVFAGLTPEERTELAGGFLQHPEPVEREASRACYSRGCDHADCREQNRLYVASRPRVTERGAIAVPHKPNDRRRRCEGQVSWEVGE
jgi:hypothetical protein